MKISRLGHVLILSLLLGAFAVFMAPAHAETSPVSSDSLAPKPNAKKSAAGTLIVQSDWCTSREDAIRNALYKGLFDEIYTKAETFRAEVISVRKKGGRVSIKMQVSWGQ